jgi:hypothetical protein
MHRPSSDQLWQQPATLVLPNPLEVRERFDPLDAQATSYLADAASISSFCFTSIRENSHRCRNFSRQQKKILERIIFITFQMVKHILLKHF